MSAADVIDIMGGQYTTLATRPNGFQIGDKVTVTPHQGEPYRGVVRGHTTAAYLVESGDGDFDVVAAKYVEAAL